MSLYSLNPVTPTSTLDRTDYQKMLGGGLGYFKDLYLNKDPLQETFNPLENFLKKETSKYNFTKELLYKAAKNPSTN